MPSSLRRDFGARLRQLRLQSGQTQEALAASADISVDFLSLVERGRTSPSFENIEKLAAALKVPVKDLFTFDSDASNGVEGRHS